MQTGAALSTMTIGDVNRQMERISNAWKNSAYKDGFLEPFTNQTKEIRALIAEAYKITAPETTGRADERLIPLDAEEKYNKLLSWVETQRRTSAAVAG